MNSYAKRRALQLVTFFVYFVGFGLLFMEVGLVRDSITFLMIFFLGQLWASIDQKFDLWSERAIKDGPQ
jgi:hypothetical protein